MKNDNFLIIAHRGESYDAPENTLASINLAWQRNVDAVEVDIQITKDEKIVIIHDKSTLRTGSIYKRISTSKYNQLLNIDIGKFKGKEWENERIPLLEEVIDSIPENKILFVEIKSDNRIVTPLQKLLDRKKINSAQIKFIGFNIATMKLVKEAFPENESYWIIEGKNYKSTSQLLKTIEKCKELKFDGLDLEEEKYLNEDVIHTVKNSGLKIFTWTVDDPARTKQLYFDGIDGITTNRASWLKAKLTEEKII